MPGSTNETERQVPDVSVLVVTYNSEGHIRHCLDTLLSQQNIDLEIIVIENNSADATPRILSDYSERITAIANRSNAGFGRANNQGAAIARGRHLYLVNPDAYLDGPGSLTRLVEYADKHRYGVVGTRIKDKDGSMETLAKRHYPRQKYSDFSTRNLPGDIAWVIGASMLIPREVFSSLGGFDENFFMYGEEADLCLRARQSGYAIGICDRASITHVGGGSEDIDQPYERWYKRHLGLQMFCSKHYSEASFARIMQRERRRAHFLKTWYLATHPIESSKDRMKGKYARYLAVLDAVKGPDRPGR
jgi:hypothetical protein